MQHLKMHGNIHKLIPTLHIVTWKIKMLYNAQKITTSDEDTSPLRKWLEAQQNANASPCHRPPFLEPEDKVWESVLLS